MDRANSFLGLAQKAFFCENFGSSFYAYQSKICGSFYLDEHAKLQGEGCKIPCQEQSGINAKNLGKRKAFRQHFFFTFKNFEFLFDLFFAFGQIIVAWGWLFSVFLLHLNSFKVSIFDQTFIKLIKFSPFLVGLLIEQVFQVILGWRRDSLHDFKVVVHIKPFFGLVPGIWLSFLLLLILALSHLFYRVDVLADRLVLGLVPWDIAVGLVLVHDLRAQVSMGLWILHQDNFILFKTL